MEETLAAISLLKSGKGSIYYNTLQLGAGHFSKQDKE